MWQQIIDNLTAFWNMPVSIIGFSVGTLTICVLTIIGKTSIGKKSFQKIKRINEELIGELNKSKDKFKELQRDYEEKLQIAEENRVLERELLLKMCETINNVKLKELAEQYKAKFDNIDFSEIVKEAKDKAVQEYKDQVDNLVKELKEEIAKLECENHGEQE